jgi:hypothetical protein
MRRGRRTARVLRAGALVSTLLALGTVAGATTLCADRRGKVSVRDVCKRHETAIAPQDVGLVGPRGADGQAGPPGAPGMVPLQVIDAAGHPFGIMLSFDGTDVTTVVQVPGVDIPLQFVIFAGGQFELQLDQDTIFYAAAGCTGMPFLAGGGSIVPVGVVIGTRGYFSRMPQTQQSVGSREYLATNCGAGTPTARGTCCASFSGTISASPAETFDPTVLGVTFPFSVVPR